MTEETDESRKDIFKGCLTLLYRLLFLLYAESRNLLPVNEEGYDRVSLSKLKKDVYHDFSGAGLAALSKKSYVYWARLESLFAIVAEGDPARNVPVYNGGLFETPKDSFLAVHKMPDPFLADAIEKLTVDHEGDYSPDIIPFIDYSSLNVRHLGDIYEGLLEFHVRTAEQEIVEVKEKGKALWKKADELKEGTKTYRKKSKGDVYIENSKHERKATGSYYTPHYIVEYIVKNTVGPILDERLSRASESLKELETLYKKQKKELKKTKDWKHWEHPGEPKGKHIAEIIEKEKDVFTSIFDIKVLDPAMGSGHFLVHTVDFISDRIIAFLADYPENPVIRRIAELKKEILEEIRRQGVRIDESKLTEVNLIKRMVMKRCIYGVDLNDMAVELAKLSLWLDSFTLGAPLSFLDHHLKCGNSLVGVFEISEVILPKMSSLKDKLFTFDDSETFAKVQRLLSYMIQISELTDSTISEAKRSYELFNQAIKEIKPICRRFDVSVAKYFISLGTSVGRVEQLAYSMAFEKEPYPEIVELCNIALTAAKDDKYFHWKIEFPEVFYAEKGEKENAGFDCVIGNPPYVRQEELGSFKKDYLKPNYKVFNNIADLYTYFFERGIEALKKGGIFGMITSNKFMKTNYGLPLRKYLADNTFIKEIVDFGELPVFEDAATFPAIFIIQRSNDLPISSLRYSPIRTLQFESLEHEVDKSAREIEHTSLKHDVWSLAKEDISHVLKKMENYGISLSVYCEGKIKYGVKTGLNEAFIIDKKTWGELLKQDHKIDKFIKPLIVGDDVRKYEINFSEIYLIVVPSSYTKKSILKEIFNEYDCIIADDQKLYKLMHCIDDKKKWAEKCKELNVDCWKNEISEKIFESFKVKVNNAFEWFSTHYPGLASHLKNFKEKAEIRADKGDFWWELRPCDYYEYFESPKIVYPEIAKESRFAFDDTGVYPLKTIFTIPSNDLYLLAILNSNLTFQYLKNICSVLGDADKRGRLLQQLIYVEKLPIPRISFTTPEEERKERVAEAVELYKSYMVDLDKGYQYEKADETDKHDRALESKPDAGREEETLSGKHPTTGKRVHGVRRRAGKSQDAERVSEDIERYPSTTRFIESSLGIKSYSELAPHLAKGVERVMACLLQLKPEELTFTPEFVCKLHKDAFGELFPSWAGSYRDRNVTVSKHTPPPYFEVPVLLRQYCEDLESRLAAIGQKPPVTDILLETLSFAEGRFLSIHPFLDFNGRVARMLLFTLLYRLDLPPVQLVPSEGDENEKAEYLNALSEADSFNLQPLMDIWRKRFRMRSEI
ncbi:MAG: Eco57I restriction-modification methylase domain-containing protein [Thermodesulfovibrionales bacterium]|nr:Eco57I restriction-modification methylase domain-containing protein [Thermodesulfovibrionales bacterium]